MLPVKQLITQQQWNQGHCAVKIHFNLIAAEVFRPIDQERCAVGNLNRSVLRQHCDRILQTGGYTAVSTTVGASPQ